MDTSGGSAPLKCGPEFNNFNHANLRLSNCWCFQSWGISLAIHLIGTARVLTDEINIIRYIYHWWMKTFGETVHIFAGSVHSIEQNIIGPMTSPYVADFVPVERWQDQFRLFFLNRNILKDSVTQRYLSLMINHTKIWWSWYILICIYI